MKILKICFVLLGLLFLLNIKVQAQCFAPVSIRSVPHEVSLNADNSIDIPITIQANKGCPLTLSVRIVNVEMGGRGTTHVNDMPTSSLQTTLTVQNTSVGTVYEVICGSAEYGFNDGGCTIIVVP